jgi:undecaprenyl-phosphate 4-deoxy-4-formamido-L-arabinose transferase
MSGQASPHPEGFSMEEIELSIVVPVYNSMDCLDALVARLTEVFRATGRSYEIILVNDGSLDRSWLKIVDLAGRHQGLRGVNLRRNFGQDNAIMAGLKRTRGRAVIIMDDDLQHDPADAGKLLQKLDEEYDVCYARFPVKRQARWKNLGSWINDRVATLFLNKPKHIYLSPYKAIAGDVARTITEYEGPYPYVDGLLFRVTQNITQVEVTHHGRYAGRGNYTLRKSISVWLNLATSFSLTPLRFATYLGFGFASLGLVMAAYFVALKLLGSNAPLGWASTMVAILVLGGVQLACLGVIGEYVGRVLLHVNKRPQYVVKETVEKT